MSCSVSMYKTLLMTPATSLLKRQVVLSQYLAPALPSIFDMSYLSRISLQVLEMVVLALSRDAWVRDHSLVQIHKPLIGHECPQQPKGTAVPPCGFLPFRGFINYAAPLCFMYEAPEPIFFLLRAMFARLWCRVNALRSQPSHLLHVAKTFEDLLQRYHPRLFFHLIRVNVNPLQLAMPWIQFGFVSYLEVDQVYVIKLIHIPFVPSLVPVALHPIAGLVCLSVV